MAYLSPFSTYFPSWLENQGITKEDFAKMILNEYLEQYRYRIYGL